MFISIASLTVAKKCAACILGLLGLPEPFGEKNKEAEFMRRARIAERLIRLAITLLTTFLLLSWSTAFAEMKIVTKDGQTHIVPIQACDIKSIEFTAQGSASGFEGYLGCYGDRGRTSGRDLTGFSSNDSQMTTEKCVSRCREKGFLYAGTQNGTWCFCGNMYGSYGPADTCDTKCGGNRSQICGG